MPTGTMVKPLKRTQDEDEQPKKKKPKEPENPNSVLNILKRGFMPMAERADAQIKADREVEEIKRRKANGEYAEED